MTKAQKLTHAYLSQVLPEDKTLMWRVEEKGAQLRIHIRSSKEWMLYEARHPAELLKDKFFQAVQKQLKVKGCRGNARYSTVQNMKAFRWIPLTARGRAYKRIKYGERKQREETESNRLRRQTHDSRRETQNSKQKTPKST